MSGESVITDEELEKMIANFDWISDEDSDLEEPYNDLSISINIKVSMLIKTRDSRNLDLTF